MNRRKRRLAALALLALILFNVPALGLAEALGLVPPYLFAVWALVIVLAARA